MKRQRSRNRNGGGAGGGGGKPQQNANRAFDSNGPEGVKVRGAAQHVYEKYQQLARDATTSGDRVLAENYLQHAEHYFRMIRAMQPQRPVSEILGRDQFVSGFDIDFEDESGAGEASEAEGETEANAESTDGGGERPYANQPRRDEYRQNDGRQNDYRQNDQRQGDQRQGEWRPRQDRPMGERSQNDRPERNANDRVPNDRGQADRYQNDRFEGRPRNSREDRPRYGRDDRAPRPEVDPLAMVEPEATPLTAPSPPSAAPVLRADDGETSHAPAFLQSRPAEPRPDAEERRPRRRRPAAARDDAPTNDAED
jgi:hypothetical protein